MSQDKTTVFNEDPLKTSQMDGCFEKELENYAKRILGGESICKVQADLPTDIFNWAKILDWIGERFAKMKKGSNCDFGCHKYDAEMMIVAILWIENLIRAPFDLSMSLSQEEVSDLTGFLIFHLKHLKRWEFKKAVVKCLASLANQLGACSITEAEESSFYINKDADSSMSYRKEVIDLSMNHKEEVAELLKNSDDTLLPKKNEDTDLSVDHGNADTSKRYAISTQFFAIEDEMFYLFNTSVTEIEFYCFIKSLCRLKKLPRKLAIISEEDSVTVKRYKIKIISYLTDASTVICDILELLKLINTNDSRLGWTISKSIYRMSRLLDKKSLITDLKNLLKDQIFTDEFCWINVMCILSFLILDNESIGDIGFVDIALKYENEFFNRGSLLKETAIFVVWALARTGNDVSILTRRIVYTALFDINYSCRRAAASVIQELVGRNKMLEDIPYSLTITTENIKRRLQNIAIFDEFTDKESYSSFFEQSLYSYDRVTREIAAILISKYADHTKITLRYETVIEIDGTNLLINQVLENTSIGCEDMKRTLNEFQLERFGKLADSFILSNLNYKRRNMDLACESYLKIVKYFNYNATVKENLLFLAMKNFSPLILYRMSHPCFNDSEFSKKIFDLFNKNSSFILMNANNQMFAAEVGKKARENIKTGKFVDSCILSLQLSKAFDHETQLIVSECLNDYSVSFNGDIGSFNRRAALEYFCSIDRQDCYVSSTNLFIRFLSDKSKKLRDDVLKAMLSAKFVQFQGCFPFIDYNSFLIKDCCYDDTGIFTNFFSSFSSLISSNGYEESYFKALFASFINHDEFYIGIHLTLETSDSSLNRILKSEIKKYKFMFFEKMDLIRGLNSKCKLIEYLRKLQDEELAACSICM